MNSQSLCDRLIDTGLFALQLFAELAVLFVLVSFLVGALRECLHASKTRRHLSARHGRGYLIGAFAHGFVPDE